MDINHYYRFEDFLDRGLKQEASASVRDFISSFDSEEEVRKWVWEFLPNLKTNGNSRIRYELFQELIFPVLKAGYEVGDFKSVLWLGKLSQNLYQARELHKEINWMTEIGFYNKAFELAPDDDEVRFHLLRSLISWLEYTEHEWPAAILYGLDGATLDNCHKITQVVEQVLSLDKEEKYIKFVRQFTKKLEQYKARLTNST